MKNIKRQFLELENLIHQGSRSRPLLEKMEVADIASFLSSHEDQISVLIPTLISIGKIGSVLAELPEDKIPLCFEEMDDQQMDRLFESSQMDDLVYLVGFMEDDLKQRVLSRTSKAAQIKRFLQYSENQAGRIMQSPAFALPSKTSAADSIDQLRKRSLEESIFYIYCIDDQERLIGVVSMRQLATAPANTPLEKLIKKDIVYVQPTMSNREVAKVVAHYNFLALPVVDENQKLLGIITMDDIIDIIQEQNTANIYARAGLQVSEKIHTSPWVSIQNRLPWMFINLIFAILASSVISLFEETMSLLIVLASLKNIVASMGGNTAIQTLTVTTRGMATGDFRFTPFSMALMKEMIVGFVMGLIMGVTSAVIIYLWKGDLMVSIIICISMILNFLMGVVAGSFIPILLSRFKRDPAAGSGVIVTMITDIFGFFTFLGIASLGLRFFT